jgi:HD-GYP domain-containing protein (c-di-GMP phosphodiesterase class II)
MSQVSVAPVGGKTPTFLAETSKLRPGSVLSRPLCDAAGILLLNAGETVTDAIKQRLLQRKIEQVVLSREDAAAVGEPTEARKKAAKKSRKKNTASQEEIARHAAVANSVSSLTRMAGVPMKQMMVRHGAEPYDRNMAAKLATRFGASTKSLEIMLNKVINGSGGNGATLYEIASGYAKEMLEDLDHVLTTSAKFADVKAIVQRSLRLSIMGMAIGMELSLDATAVGELGMCGLVQDWGLLCLPERLRNFNEPFNEDDWDCYYRHPTLTLDVLERVGNLPAAVRVAASQVHEMCDGSGYPRGLCYNRIHQYARILGPIDAYLALTECRHGRPAIVPHDAMACLLHQIPLGRFDPEPVRALLHTLSLFPLGSYVRLSDGAIAVVIRRGTSDYSKPIVSHIRLDLAHSLHDDADATIVDLATCDIQIDDVLLTPGIMEMRLERSMMYDIIWDGPEA